MTSLCTPGTIYRIIQACMVDMFPFREIFETPSYTVVFYTVTEAFLEV